MSQIIFHAKLIDVQSSQNDKGITWRLVFKSQRYDRGLDEFVPCSQNVKIIDDHTHLLDTYRAYKNREIYLPIEQSTMDRNIYYKTTSDGRPLNLIEKVSNEKVTT